MADFQMVFESMTLEEYRRRDAAGEITRPLSWPPIRLRSAEAYTNRPTDDLTERLQRAIAEGRTR